MRGGYKIMNFKDVVIASTSDGASTKPVEIEGIYEAFESNCGKIY